MWKFLCYFGHAYCKSGEILSSGNIIITFSTLSSVGTTNFMRLACLVWPEKNIKLCYLSWKNPQQINVTSTLVLIVHQSLIIWSRNFATPNLKGSWSNWWNSIKIGGGEMGIFPEIGPLDMEWPHLQYYLSVSNMQPPASHAAGTCHMQRPLSHPAGLCHVQPAPVTCSGPCHVQPARVTCLRPVSHAAGPRHMQPARVTCLRHASHAAGQRHM